MLSPAFAIDARRSHASNAFTKSSVVPASNSALGAGSCAVDIHYSVLYDVRVNYLGVPLVEWSMHAFIVPDFGQPGSVGQGHAPSQNLARSPLDRAGEALNRQATHQVRGKLVLAVE